MLLGRHLEELGIAPQLYLVEWIFTLYAKVLPEPVTAWVPTSHPLHTSAFRDRYSCLLYIQSVSI